MKHMGKIGSAHGCKNADLPVSLDSEKAAGITASKRRSTAYHPHVLLALRYAAARTKIICEMRRTFRFGSLVLATGFEPLVSQGDKPFGFAGSASPNCRRLI